MQENINPEAWARRLQRDESDRRALEVLHGLPSMSLWRLALVVLGMVGWVVSSLFLTPRGPLVTVVACLGCVTVGLVVDSVLLRRRVDALVQLILSLRGDATSGSD